jgi:hypothetical protein
VPRHASKCWWCCLLLLPLLLQYIREPSCIILAVSAANTDLANSDALQMAQLVDAEGARTIGEWLTAPLQSVVVWGVMTLVSHRATAADGTAGGRRGRTHHLWASDELLVLCSADRGPRDGHEHQCTATAKLGDCSL